MSTAIICLILIVICIYSIKSYAKKLSHGCCGQESRVSHHTRNYKQYPYCYKIWIDGISCQNCLIKIENTFNQDKNNHLHIHSKTHTGTLYTKTPLSHDKIIQTIETLGYKVINIENVINK